ncbi:MULTISPECIES: DUF3261 domain-containing protein [unclassified Pseudoalteromonas]|jgi:hypothetical protein|uniref:DUF3261 domain-containing protein n=1 Tax=unclassified Pseudoalteromonas TaxID=194690 RepID=UPI00257486D0|nr:DUF3261 domain-containing protein [Pseudoalteromonas sp. MM1]BED91170.1 hypothetical protein PspMM1_36380 [Pseudoalteromonas sp. MM1]
MSKLIPVIEAHISYFLRCTFIVLACVYVTACSSTYKSSERVDIFAATTLDISHVPEQMFDKSWQHVLYIKNNEKEHTLLAQLEINKQGTISLLLMTTQGLPILTLEKLNNQPPTVSKMIVGVDIDPAYILADIALVHWPISFLNEKISGALIEQTGVQRRLVKDNRSVILIDYTDNKTVLNNSGRHYQITFEKVNQ